MYKLATRWRTLQSYFVYFSNQASDFIVATSWARKNTNLADFNGTIRPFSGEILN